MTNNSTDRRMFCERDNGIQTVRCFWFSYRLQS